MTLELMSYAALTVADIRQARHLLPRSKTCGSDGVVTEMLHACVTTDFLWAVAFSRLMANGIVEEGALGVQADPTRDAFSVSVVSKCEAPKQFRFLRPSAIPIATSM